jgi:hypothetical protein
LFGSMNTEHYIKVMFELTVLSLSTQWSLRFIET